VRRHDFDRRRRLGDGRHARQSGERDASTDHRGQGPHQTLRGRRRRLPGHKAHPTRHLRGSHGRREKVRRARGYGIQQGEGRRFRLHQGGRRSDPTPIDGSITILEDITGNTAKTAAVGDANKSLQSGERGDAINKLKVAGIEVAVVLAVVPIDKTIDEVHQAALLIDAGKYYEGSQQLRMAESNERFDMIGNLGTPKE